MKNRLLIKKFLTYFFAFLVFLIMFFPLYGLILTSVQPENIIRSRNLSFFPSEIIFSHFAEVLKPNHISNIYAGIKTGIIGNSSSVSKIDFIRTEGGWRKYDIDKYLKQNDCLFT